MNRRSFIAATAVVGGGALTACGTTNSEKTLRKGEIIHSVMFDLKQGKEAPESHAFLEEGRKILSVLPSVRDFQVFKQVSPKCDYSFGFSMVFEGPEAYSAYNNHPNHLKFVSERWNNEVTRFQEIDYEPY